MASRYSLMFGLVLVRTNDQQQARTSAGQRVLVLPFLLKDTLFQVYMRYQYRV